MNHVIRAQTHSHVQSRSRQNVTKIQPCWQHGTHSYARPTRRYRLSHARAAPRQPHTQVHTHAAIDPCSDMQKHSPPHSPQVTILVGHSSTGSHERRGIQTLTKYSGSRGGKDTPTPRRMPSWGGSPFRGAGGGRKQPGQSSALSPSNSADSESRHLPLTEPQTLPCTPDPPQGLLMMHRANLCYKKAPSFTPGGPQSCAVAIDRSRSLHTRPGGGGGEEWGAGLPGRCCGPCGYCLAA